MTVSSRLVKQQERLPQAAAPVVPDHSDNDPTCQRRHYSSFQSHRTGTLRRSLHIRDQMDRLRRRTGAAPAFGLVDCPRRLEVVAAATDSTSRCTHDRQHQTDEEHDDSDGPEDRNLEQESGNDKMIPRMIMAVRPFCPPDCPLGNRTGRRLSTLISVRVPLRQDFYAKGAWLWGDHAGKASRSINPSLSRVSQIRTRTETSVRQLMRSIAGAQSQIARNPARSHEGEAAEIWSVGASHPLRRTPDPS